MQLRDQMIRQVKAMFKTSLVKKQCEMASVVAAAVRLVLTEVSIQDDLARMDVDLQGAMKACKGSPLDDVPTGDAGFPADAIIQGDIMEPGMRIQDYKMLAATYLRHTYEANCSPTDVDPGWSDPSCMFEERPANCSDDRVWGNFIHEIPDNRELSIFSYKDICEARGFELPHPSTLGKECRKVCSWLSRILRHVGNQRRTYGRPYRMQDKAYGMSMDSGGWFRWNKICDVAPEAIPTEMLPQQKFTLPAVCALASIGYDLKQRF